MSYSFSTKARTLNLLQGILSSANVLPLVFFTVSDWQMDSTKCVQMVVDKLGIDSWIVRSSCQREDNNETSNSGAFLSLQNITQDGIEDAIDKVIKSYGEACLDDEILIQPMLENVICSGVAFSHDPNNCAPYRVITRSEGSDTTAVTGGLSGKTWQQAALSPVTPPAALVSVIALVEELLTLFDQKPVDCEFAVTTVESGERLWLLQARPLLLKSKSESNEIQQDRLQKIEKKVSRGMAGHPFLMGKKTVYGVMPDWNPAEIIGIRPKPLALSLYRELVTDEIWAYQRNNYGYRNLRSFPLMPHFFGLPYIDLRLSFNSFIPADLDESLAGRLVDLYIDCLLKEPKLHDKVEFEIVFSCYTLDLPDRLQQLGDEGFSKSDQEIISNSLRDLTNRIIHPQDGLWKSDWAKMDILNSRREQIHSSNADPLGRVYWLLEDAKRYGTLPFAGLARAGFVAVQMLQSLVSVKVLSQEDYEAFFGSLTTVSGQLASDRVNMDQATFLAKYGHLRPGTYDILSSRYDESPELYFDWSKRPSEPEPVKPFSFTLPQMRELASLLESHGLHPDPVGLFNFLQAGIEMREMSKFHFTKNLSDALALISEYGYRHGFSREDLAYCDLSVFKELHVAALDPVEMIDHSIAQGKARYKETLAVSLPPLIANVDDVWGFEHLESEPNFITQKQVIASVMTNIDKSKLAGAIVCLPNADPGYDWLFSYKIAGLITEWGGVNSHMAIRAGELGLPAVIGAGESLYQRWSGSKRLHLDCSCRRVEVLA